MRTPRFRKAIGVFIAGSMVFGSTGAIAASAPANVPQFDPWAVLSVMNGGASAAAACGVAVSAAAAAAAAAQPANGCVLPQIDAAPSAGPPPPQPIPVPPVETVGGGFGISPLLLGLVAIAAGVGLYFALRKHHANSPS